MEVKCVMYFCCIVCVHCVSHCYQVCKVCVVYPDVCTHYIHHDVMSCNRVTMWTLWHCDIVLSLILVLTDCI